MASTFFLSARSYVALRNCTYTTVLMSKLPYAKYLFSIWAVAIVLALVAKFITANVLVLITLSLGLYWISVRGLAKIKGLQ